MSVPLAADTFAALYLARSEAVPGSAALTVSDIIAALRAGSIVKSIQYGTVTIDPSAATSATATIASVNTSRALLIGLGFSASDDATETIVNYVKALPRITLSNATTVTLTTAQVNGGKITGITQSFVVVEFF